MENFEKDVVDRLARIEEILKNKPCIQHAIDIQALKDFRLQIVTIAGVVSAIVSVVARLIS